MSHCMKGLKIMAWANAAQKCKHPQCLCNASAIDTSSKVACSQLPRRPEQVPLWASAQPFMEDPARHTLHLCVCRLLLRLACTQPQMSCLVCTAHLHTGQSSDVAERRAEQAWQATAWPQGLDTSCTLASMPTMQASCSVAPPAPVVLAAGTSERLGPWLCPGLLFCLLAGCDLP